jgi:hypothetical protein
MEIKMPMIGGILVVWKNIGAREVTMTRTTGDGLSDCAKKSSAGQFLTAIL